MERTEELLKAANIYCPRDETDKSVLSSFPEWTPYSRTVTRVSIFIAENETLVRRMEKLVGRKEFSNDPTEAMAEISGIFQKNTSLIQADIGLIKRFTDDNNQSSTTHHQHQHYKIILQSLNKKIAEHVDCFKQALKTHSDHVKQRQQRVMKYGQGNDQLKAGTGTSRETVQSYAMFASRGDSQSRISTEHEKSQDLRRRAAGSTGHGDISSVSCDGSAAAGLSSPSIATSYSSSAHVKGLNKGPRGVFGGASGKSYSRAHEHYSGSATGGGGILAGVMQEQELQQRAKNSDARLHSAQKVEASIAQMGELFTQMASLVMEQSETILRIEDDVECGLQNTVEAHQSMEKVYDITKGNRGMILKIFALLVFFIVVFLVLT